MMNDRQHGDESYLLRIDGVPVLLLRVTERPLFVIRVAGVDRWMNLDDGHSLYWRRGMIDSLGNLLACAIIGRVHIETYTAAAAATEIF